MKGLASSALYPAPEARSKMLLQNLAAVSAIAGIAAGASLPSGRSSPGSHGQSPLITQEPQQIIYDVRRFHVGSSGELDEILHHAKASLDSMSYWG
ncbi:hypothetical protein FS837_006709 [Tulasnella sp. UAMH 9824]|nr:hypothetical protein FS837_006709 [Tulasnella sp. UAMH 9824]